MIRGSSNKAFVSSEANIEDGVEIGGGTSVWGLTHIREGAQIGSKCTIGEGCYIDSGVTIGSFSKIQNGALIFAPAQIGERVFIGPAAVLTNDQHPRATNAVGHPKTIVDWKPVGVVVELGASIGAGAVCVAPITIGTFAMVGAGAVVTRDVKPHSLVVGVPAEHVGWVGQSGRRLIREGDYFVCKQSDKKYYELGGQLVRLESTDS